jgi:hypothetical protein
MDSRQGLPPDQRYLKKIADDKEKRVRDTKDERKSRHNHNHNVAKDALPVSLDDGFRRSTWHDRRNSKRVPKLYLGGVISGVGSPATPPTPPMSPIQSRTRSRGAPAAPSASTVRSQEIQNLLSVLAEQQSQIDALTITLEDTQNEVQRLRNERRKAIEERVCAVYKDNEEEIERCRRREKRLVEMVEEGQQSIEGLEKEVDGYKEEKRDLMRRLTEAEKRAGEIEMGLEKTETDIVGEDLQRMSEKRGQDRKGRRADGAGWEVRRRKGSKATHSGAIRQMHFAGKPL